MLTTPRTKIIPYDGIRFVLTCPGVPTVGRAGRLAAISLVPRRRVKIEASEANRVEDALEYAQRPLDLCRRLGAVAGEPASRSLGDIHADREPRQTAIAEGWYRQGMALAEKLEMRPCVAHCHLGLGQVYRRAGRRGRTWGDAAASAARILHVAELALHVGVVARREGVISKPRSTPPRSARMRS